MILENHWLSIFFQVLTDLRSRVKNDLERLVNPLQDRWSFQYGFNSDYLEGVGVFWLQVYNWTIHERTLNQFDHFKTQIDGIDLHFIHAKPKDPKGKRVVPLLMVHGWPGEIL